MPLDAASVDMFSYRRLQDTVIKQQMDLTTQQQHRFPRMLLPHHIVQAITRVYILKTNLTNRVSCLYCALQLLHVVWLSKNQMRLCNR